MNALNGKEKYFVNMLNQLIIEGSVSKKAEVKETPYGTVAEFEIETKRYYKNKSEETVEETSTFDCECYGKMAEFMQDKKENQKVRIVGRLKQKTWESYGKKHSKVYIVVEHIEFIRGV